MALNLHSKKSIKTIKPKKRIGRGPGSGKGTYATKGLKGQRARSGGRKYLKRLGMKANIQSIPKLPGFKSRFPKMAVINLEVLDKNFKDGDIVNESILLEKGLIIKKGLGLKILGNGNLTKKLVISATSASTKAVEVINNSGSTLKLSKFKSKDKVKVKKEESAKI